MRSMPTFAAAGLMLFAGVASAAAQFEAVFTFSFTRSPSVGPMVPISHPCAWDTA